MTLPKGTLVRIKDDAVSPNKDSEMHKQITNHGHLWIIDGPINGMVNEKALPLNWYWCKALSSGVVYDWNEDEFETAKEEENANPAG